MPLIDDRGRLFGRLNIIDAALIGFLVVLVPIAYTSVRLFRVRQPVIQAVTPRTQPPGRGRRVRITGTDFRAYLRAFVAPSGQPFSLINHLADGTEALVRLETPGAIEMELPDLPSGSYDLYLFDETQQVAHAANAFELTATRLRARIKFSVPAAAAALVHDGDVDVSDPTGPVAVTYGENTSGAMLVSVHALGTPASAMVRTDDGYLVLTNTATTIDADVDIPARQNAHGYWEYGMQPIRVGAGFAFRTPRYVIQGLIESITAPGPDSR